MLLLDFPGGSGGKASAYSAGDQGSIPGSGRSPGEGHGNPVQYFCLENPTDGGAWWATVHGVAKSWTRLRDLISLHFTSCCYLKEFVKVANSVLVKLNYKITNMGKKYVFLNWQNKLLNQSWKHQLLYHCRLESEQLKKPIYYVFLSRILETVMLI